MADAAASQESIGTQSSTGGLVVTDGSDPGGMGKPDRGNVCDDDEYDRIGAEALEAVEQERRELSEPSSASTTRIRPAFSLVTSQVPLPPLGPVPPNVTPMPPNVTQYTQLTCAKTPPGVAALKDEVADRSAHIIQLEHTLELEQQKQLQTKNRIAARGRAEADRLMGLLKAQATELDEARARVKKLGETIVTERKQHHAQLVALKATLKSTQTDLGAVQFEVAELKRRATAAHRQADRPATSYVERAWADPTQFPMTQLDVQSARAQFVADIDDAALLALPH